MYGQIPYMFPGAMMQAAPSAASGLANAGNLANAAKAGGSLLSKVNWSSLLSNAQKTLNVVNQAIPLYYQAKPVFKNLRTLGRIGKEFTKIGTNNNNQPISTNTITGEAGVNQEEIINTENTSQNVPEPTFFL